MRNFLFLCLTLILGLHCAAQKKDSIYVWNKWCARKDTLLLFTASYNVIEVYSPGFRPGDIYLKSLDKTLKISGVDVIEDTLTMMAMPYTTEKPMRLAIMDKATNKPLKTILFYGTDVPAPLARLGHLKENEAPKVNILAQVGLNVYFPNSLYNYPYHITSFALKTHYDKADVNIAGKGHLISRDMEQAITRTPVGSVISFTDIKATCPDCITRQLDDLLLKIK